MSMGYWQVSQTILYREGPYRSGFQFGGKQRQIFPCKDGFVVFYISGGGTGAKSNQAITDWMSEEGMADDFIKGIDWPNFDMATTTQEVMDKLEHSIGKFFLTHT